MITVYIPLSLWTLLPQYNWHFPVAQWEVGTCPTSFLFYFLIDNGIIRQKQRTLFKDMELQALLLQINELEEAQSYEKARYNEEYTHHQNMKRELEKGPS